MKRNRFQVALRIVLAGFAVITVLLMWFSAGPPPVPARCYTWQEGWFFPGLFVLFNLSPYYILFRMDQRKENRPRDHVIYLAGALLVGGFGLVTRSYDYSLPLTVYQVATCLILRFVSWASASRLRLGRTVLAILAIGGSFVINYALAPYVYLPRADDYFGDKIPRDVKGQLEYFYWLWDDPERIGAARQEMRSQNPEWDMISQTFFAYSLANVALKYPSERKDALHYLDKVIDTTVEVPWREFLLPYGSEQPFVRQPASSVMVDGEVSLMIGLRRLIKDEAGYAHRGLHRKLITRCVDAMEAGPVLCGECYPDECWLWCNPLALTSIKVFDILEGTDHSDLFYRWEVMAKKKLLHPDSGLIHSAVTLDGYMIHPPEGSTIWIGAQCLLPVLPDFAAEQYTRMKELLTGRLLCFSFGREWPRGTRGEWDIDSGFTPFGMGPASTGFALVASKEFGDKDLFVRLLGLLEFVGVPRYRAGRMRYLSSNPVGDAIFLYAKTTGPAWREIKRRSQPTGPPVRQNAGGEQ